MIQNVNDKFMITYSIIKQIKLKQIIEQLCSGTESLQTRIKVELKSYKSRLCLDGSISLPANRPEMSYHIKHRAPPL